MTADWSKILSAVLLAAVLAGSPAAGRGEAVRPVEREPDLDRIIHEMEEVRRSITDLIAVIDYDSSAPGEESSPRRITLSYKSPDKLKTEVAGGREVLINGDQMWIYSPELGVVEAYHLRDEEQRRATLYEMSWGLTSPIRVLLRGTERSFTRLEDGSFLVTVIPDGSETEISRIRARVDPRTWLIREMTISSKSAPPVRLKIGQWRINTGMDAGRFDFQLPEGAELFPPLETGGEVVQ